MGKQERTEKDMKNKPALLAVAHDAGGAEVLSSYIRHRAKEYKRISCIAEGPAKYIFSRKGLKRYIIKPGTGKKEILSGKIDFVLTSTSMQGSLETGFISMAKEKEIKTASILDHWINYKKRFGYPHSGWQKNLADELWATDALAVSIAAKEFRGRAITKKKPNFYFKDLKNEYKRLAACKKNGIFNVLFLNDMCGGQPPRRQKKIKRLLRFMKNAGRYRRETHFKIRLHPSESAALYKNTAKKYSGTGFKVKISVPEKVSLVKDLKSADLVIGFYSMALVISRLFNKNTLCCAERFPAWLKGHGIQCAGDKI